MSSIHLKVMRLRYMYYIYCNWTKMNIGLKIVLDLNVELSFFDYKARREFFVCILTSREDWPRRVSWRQSLLESRPARGSTRWRRKSDNGWPIWTRDININLASPLLYVPEKIKRMQFSEDWRKGWRTRLRPRLSQGPTRSRRSVAYVCWTWWNQTVSWTVHCRFQREVQEVKPGNIPNVLMYVIYDTIVISRLKNLFSYMSSS